MQSFGSLLSDNRSMAILIGLIAAVVVAVLALLLYRGLFGRRLHMAGGRSRQPRLGVVDAFDLDRQRQLVLVRRDNVEHLIMIGGPNDLVIESAFVRAQPTVQIPNGREKDAAVPPPVAASLPAPAAPAAPATPPLASPPPDVPAAPPPSPTPAPEPAFSRPEPALARPEPIPPLRVATSAESGNPVTPGDLGPLADLPAPGPVAEPSGPVRAPDAASPPAGAEPSAPAAPPRPLFPRPATPPRAGGGASSLPPRPPLTALRPPPSGATRPLVTRPVTPLQRGTSAASLRREPLAGPAAPATPPAGEAAPPPPASGEPAATGAPPDTALPITLDSIESLEEEMAKLLGRASSDKR